MASNLGESPAKSTIASRVQSAWSVHSRRSLSWYATWRAVRGVSGAPAWWAWEPCAGGPASAGARTASTTGTPITAATDSATIGRHLEIRTRIIAAPLAGSAR